jgi:transcriptional regulator with XRE-family HTH domain
MKLHSASNENSDPRISTVDSSGTPYNERLKRARMLSGKSAEDIARSLGMSFPEYDEWESHASELSYVISLSELSKLASVLGISTSAIFEDERERGRPILPEDLIAKVKSHLEATEMSVLEFQDRAGWEIGPALQNASAVLGWNVDCLRSVCAETGVNWLDALP